VLSKSHAPWVHKRTKPNVCDIQPPKDYEGQYLSQSAAHLSHSRDVEGVKGGKYSYVVMKLPSSSTEKYRRFRRSAVSILWVEDRSPWTIGLYRCLPRNVQEAYASRAPCITLGPRWGGGCLRFQPRYSCTRGMGRQLSPNATTRNRISVVQPVGTLAPNF
jgi:hypothetical protein